MDHMSDNIRIKFYGEGDIVYKGGQFAENVYILYKGLL